MYQSALTALENGGRGWTLWGIAQVAQALDLEFVLPLRERGKADSVVGDRIGVEAGDTEPKKPGATGVELNEDEFQMLMAWRAGGPVATIMLASSMIEARPRWRPHLRK